MLLFGLTGTFAELSLGGFNPGLWVFVYGWMVYLPAYSLPPRDGLHSPRLIHRILAVLLPIVFAIPVAGIIHLIHPISIHFPPIQ